MNENNPQYLPPPPAGMGCFAKGCLTVLVVGVLLVVMMGGFGWYVMHTVVKPFISDHPAAIRVFPATDAQYEAVRQKVDPFDQAVNTGHAASLTLTADELNILIARDSSPSSLRGKFYLSIDHNSIAADVSYPLNGKKTSQQPTDAPTTYFNGHVVFDASFANGEFTLVLRRIEPIGGGRTPGLIAWFLANPGFSQGFNRSFNDGFRDSIEKNQTSENFINRLQTVIVQNNEIIATTAASPVPVATPSSSP